MPIINWVYALENNERGAEHEVLNTATEKMDEATNLLLSVNGMPVALDLPAYRASAIVSDATLPDSNIFDIEPGPTSIVVDGYWILFRPLIKDLTISTNGTCQSGSIRISVNYHITVAEV